MTDDDDGSRVREQKHHGLLVIGLSLMGLSALLYLCHFMLFHDAHHRMVSERGAMGQLDLMASTRCWPSARRLGPQRVHLARGS